MPHDKQEGHIGHGGTSEFNIDCTIVDLKSEEDSVRQNNKVPIKGLDIIKKTGVNENPIKSARGQERASKNKDSKKIEEPKSGR